MRYTRRHAVEAGRALCQKDMGGSLVGPPGRFAANPYFGMHPANAMQIPPLSGPGGYTSPPNQNTPPGAVMMAMQNPMASGGRVSDPLSDARRLLVECQRSVGGSVIERKQGGSVDGELDVSNEAKKLLGLWEKIEHESPNVDSDRRFTYLIQRSPGAANFFRKLMADGWSRSGARAQIRGALIRWAEGQ
jgi:hypothetical protein